MKLKPLSHEQEVVYSALLNELPRGYSVLRTEDNHFQLSDRVGNVIISSADPVDVLMEMREELHGRIRKFLPEGMELTVNALGCFITDAAGVVKLAGDANHCLTQLKTGALK